MVCKNQLKEYNEYCGIQEQLNKERLQPIRPYRFKVLCSSKTNNKQNKRPVVGGREGGREGEKEGEGEEEGEGEIIKYNLYMLGL